MLKLKKPENTEYNLRTLIESFLSFREEITDAKLDSIKLLTDDKLYVIRVTFEDGDWEVIPLENEED